MTIIKVKAETFEERVRRWQHHLLVMQIHGYRAMSMTEKDPEDLKEIKEKLEVMVREYTSRTGRKI